MVPHGNNTENPRQYAMIATDVEALLVISRLAYGVVIMDTLGVIFLPEPLRVSY